MTRKKVKLAYITNDYARKVTFKKRKKGLIKKVDELSTLCGIEACVIIYSPYDAQPKVWPSPTGVQHVLSQFKNMPEMEQSNKMVNQESFLKQRLGKANDQLKKQRKENREKEVTRVMFQSLIGKTLTNLNMINLNDLSWIIDQHLKDIRKKAETNNKEITSQMIAVAPPLPPPPPPPPPPQPQPPLPLPPKLPSPPPFAPETSIFAGPIMEVAPFQEEAERQTFEANMEAIKRHQWIMEAMSPHENFGFLGDYMMLPFGDTNKNSLWSSSFFP
ncbi:agamous-like MADS-box protein AGL80 [Ricinus communis]|uniref:agamous-like MADS-box protein AGL80 n=1 Tax=Ricinus communis TaxID=3988 RepID=UPI00201B1535|nr:agamous-like MADS-box protein AGL80 [Ricinus communis]